MKIQFDTNGNERQKDVCRAWLDPGISEIVYGGSKGSGKSYLGASLIFGDAFLYPETHYFIARKELNDLRKYTIPTIYEAIKNMGVDDRYVKFNGQDNFFHCYNGSKIFLLEAKYQPSDPLYMRFGSMSMTRGWIEEAGEFEEAAKNNLMASVGRWKNDVYNLPPKLLQTCNPSKNYLYREFYKKNKEGTLEGWKRFIQALPEDNKKLPPGYLENLRRSLDKNQRERLLHGNWEYDDDPAALIQYDNILNCFTNDFVGKIKGNRYISADIARLGRDRTVIGLWDELTCFRIVVLEKNKIDEAAALIKRLSHEYKVPRSNIIVDEDGVGCLVKGTKVLTGSGWRNIEDIKPGDVIYSKDENNNLIEAKAVKNDRREVTDIIEDKSGVSFSYSHFLPVKSRGEYPLKMRSWDNIMSNGRVSFDSGFKYAGSVFNFQLPCTRYEMPNGGYKELDNEINVTGMQLASFLGYFISEGSIENHKYIKITQNRDSRCYDDILESLRPFNISIYEKPQSQGRKGVDIIICHKGLVRWLEGNCYSGGFRSWNKKVPGIIKTATPEIIGEFLRTFNLGDGHIHKGERMYSTGSVSLAYDIHELILKVGKMATIHVKCRKSSKSKIAGRGITRRRDIYLVSELKETSGGITPETGRIYEDHVYNLEIDSATRLYMVMFDGRYKKPFFVHNGGVVDILGCKGFVNNSSALNDENYNNLKSQCYFTLARMINNNEIYIQTSETGIKDMIIEELEQVKQKDMDKDGKKAIIPKEKVKEIIGRSPDFSDMLAMRMFYELQPVWEDVFF